MGWFSSKRKSYLGIDIGSSAIKAVELLNDRGRAKLATYGFLEIESALQDGHEAAYQEFLAATRYLLGKIQTQSRLAVTSLPMYSVFSSLLHLPEMKPKEMEEAIRWEAKKIIPLPLEEMILDWKIIKNKKNSENGGKMVQVLLTSAQKTLIQKYMRFFKDLGLELLSLETEVFALTRSLIGNDQSTIMLIDMGSKTTNIMITQNGVPLMNRSLERGGKEITVLLSRQTGLPFEKAEIYKRDLRVAFTEEMKKILAPIEDEIKYTISLYENQFKGKIEKIILTGGSSVISGFSQYLSETLHARAYLGNPFSRVVYPEDLQSTLHEVGPALSIAIGLGMREIL